MLRLFFSYFQDRIGALIEKSIPNQALREFLLLFMLIFFQVVGALTDDDKDNTAQVKEILRENADRLKEAIKLLIDEISA